MKTIPQMNEKHMFRECPNEYGNVFIKYLTPPSHSKWEMRINCKYCVNNYIVSSCRDVSVVANNDKSKA